jgi:hypothetical protein
MNKNLDIEEENTYRRAKERRTQEKHERVIVYLKNMPNLKDKMEAICHALLSLIPLWGGKTT